MDILVFVFGIAGAISLIYKKKIGFILFVIHSMVWGILSALDGHTFSVITCIVFVIIDIYGYIKWTAEEKEDDVNTKVDR